MIDKLFELLSHYLNSNAALILALAIGWLLPPIVGLLVKFVWDLLRRHRKRLVWRVFQRMQLPQSGSDGLSMYVNDMKATDVGVVVFDVSSSGQEAIGSDDLPGGKMALTFGEAKVESYATLDKNPPELNLRPVLDGNRFELRTDFFNKGESAKYQVVLSNYDEARDKIRADKRLKDGFIRLAEWDMPGRVDEWGKAFVAAFIILLGSFLVLFAVSLQLISTISLPIRVVLALAMALVMAATHCWVATEAQREEAEERAYGRGPRSVFRQAWVPASVYFKQFFANRFYLRMIVVGWVLGMSPYALEWLIAFGRQVLERLK